MGFQALASNIYKIQNLSEKKLVGTYEVLMRDACKHADQFWTNWPVDPRAGFWGSGRSDNMNEGIRAISGMTLTCASLLKYSGIFTPQERQGYQSKAIAAIRYATETHVTGGRQCTDGKPWGDSWQSAMWTADLSFGAWLIWDELDAGLRKDVERVLGYEADRFLAGKPPAGSFNDTKAEENGWDLTGIAVAAAMFPKNPRAEAWREKAIEYAMNTLSVPADARDNSIVDGKPVCQWFAGANLHPDFTLENHGFFHPGYIGCSSYFLTQTAMYFTFARQPIPEAATHHLMDTWRMFQGILLANGEAACPQGMDWELHGLPYCNLFASLASYEKDPLAARLENVYIQYMRAWQKMRDGNLAAPGSKLGFTRHAICAQQAAYAFLAHKIFGPPVKALTAREAAAAVEGTHLDPWIQVAMQRTGSKFASFSWTNRIMGMVVPIGPGHEDNPDFTAPILGGMVGGFDLTPHGIGGMTAVEHTWKKTPDGFETSGALLLNGGRLKQNLQMNSIGEKTVLYQDRVFAQKGVTVAQERGVPLGIENDEITGGIRQLRDAAGSRKFDFHKPAGAVAVAGSWANVDGRLGIVMLSGAGISYNQARGYAPGISICEDILYGSYSRQPRSFKAGEEVAHRVALVFLETSPRETAALAKSARIENGPRGQVVRFKLPEGGEAEIPVL